MLFVRGVSDAWEVAVGSTCRPQIGIDSVQ